MLYTNSIKHPKLISNINGNVDLDNIESSINRSIALILLTAKGELFFNPEFGSNLRFYIFEYVTDLVTETLTNEIVDSINRWENRIQINKNNINIEQADDRLKIHISYTLTNSNITGETNVFMPIPIPKEL